MTTENYCFCDLDPLYTLDLLSEEERNWMEQQLVECPDLAEELTDYRAAVTAIAYTVSSLPMDSTLKDRLFDRLKLDTPQPEAVLEPSLIFYQAMRSQELNWQPHPTPGVEIAIVHTDLSKREIVGFLRAQPGVQYPFHRHAAIEEMDTGGRFNHWR